MDMGKDEREVIAKMLCVRQKPVRTPYGVHQDRASSATDGPHASSYDYHTHSRTHVIEPLANDANFRCVRRPPLP